MLSNELLANKFREAKAGNAEATRYLINYFMTSVERQLGNRDDVSLEVKADREVKCHGIVVRNLKLYYDVEEFLGSTMEAIKNVLYLNVVKNIRGSRSIIEGQNIISSKVTEEQIFSLGLSAKEYTIAKLYFLDNRSIKDISLITSDNEIMICSRIRRILNRLNSKKVSNYTPLDETSIYKTNL